jgi:caa(3)-type oxidase subunit IV
MHEEHSGGGSHGASHSSGHAGHGDEHAKHGGIRKFSMVFLCLLGLTAISFAVASSPIMDTPAVGWTIMIAVSCAKALLVISFFMHLIWEANWKYVLTIPASIMSLFLLLMLSPDVGMRTRRYSEARWLHAAEPQPGSEKHTGEKEDHEEQADEKPTGSASEQLP